MWFERFVIIVTSLARDFLPSSWGYYSPSIVEIFTFFGTFGVFSVLFLLFIRFLPIMPMAELKAVTPSGRPVHGPRQTLICHAMATTLRLDRHLRDHARRLPRGGAGARRRLQKLGLHHAVPVHGLDKAMGLKRSIVPRFSLAGGITGFCTGMSMIWWTGAVGLSAGRGRQALCSARCSRSRCRYELTILFTAFATIGGMFFLNGLPMHYHPVLKYDPHSCRGMDDRSSS
jgi:hypothetical protein